MLVRFILFLGQGGIAMIVTAAYTVGAAVALALFALLAFTALRTRGGTAALLSVALAILALPSGGHALEIRRDASLVSVAAGETVDDTLVVFSESVSIDGTVNGDLIVFTRSLTLTGTVTGDIVAFGQNVNVEGNVNGSVYGFGRSVDLAGGDVARNLFGFGSDVVVGTGSNVGANAAMFGNIVAVRGRVGKTSAASRPSSRSAARSCATWIRTESACACSIRGASAATSRHTSATRATCRLPPAPRSAAQPIFK